MRSQSGFKPREAFFLGSHGAFPPSPGGVSCSISPLHMATWGSSGDPPRSQFPFLMMENSGFPIRSPADKQELLYLRPF